MFSSSILCTLGLLASTAFAAPATSTASLCTPATTKQVYQFEKGSWIENIAVRSNGKILLTRLDVPEIYQLTVPATGAATAQLIASFPGSTSLTGITETNTPDVFEVLVGDFDLATFNSPADSWSVYQVDFTKPNSTGFPATTKLGNLDQLVLPDGFAKALPGQAGGYITDGDNGTISRFVNGVTTILVPGNNALTNAKPPFMLGANGLKTFGTRLYFTNSYLGYFGYFPLTATGGIAGAGVVVANANKSETPIDAYFDDFAIDVDGTAYAVTSTGNSLEQITITGQQTVIAGSLNSTTLAEPTSAAFGRQLFDLRTVYVTTAGGLAAPVAGTITVGAQVVAVQLPPLGVPICKAPGN